MAWAETLLISLGTTAGVGGLGIWIFKESIRTSLRLEMETRLNAQKSELDRMRDAFQFQVQQAMLSIQIKTERTHEIYPELWEKLRMAEGGTSRMLGLRESPTYGDFSIEDFKAMLVERKVIPGHIEKLLSAIQSDRNSGIAKLRDFLRFVEWNEAKLQHQEAKNFIVLKQLYMTDEIADMSFKICEHIWFAIVDANPEDIQASMFRKNMGAVEQMMNALKEKIRAELTHKTVEGS